MKKSIPEKKLFIIYLVAIILLLVGAVGFSVAYDSGYRVKGFKIQKTSTLSMRISEPEAWIFIGENPIRKTEGEDEVLSIPNVEPGNKLITVIKNEYFPWAKRVEVPSNSELSLYPFLLKQDVEAVKITPDSNKYLTLYRDFSQFEPQTTYDTNSHKIAATETGVSIECLDKECDIPSIETTSPVKNIYPFRENPNVVIYGTDTEIHVSELVADTRISYKIFEGQNIKFYPKTDRLYVNSRGQYFRIGF